MKGCVSWLRKLKLRNWQKSEEWSLAVLISIMIPTWNRVKQVLEAVDSIGPIMPDMEVVIVDNASEPAVFEELLRRLGDRSGIRLFRNERNLGMVKNWNRCLEEAKGEWLGLLCSDDCYLPGAIEQLRKVIAASSGPAMIIQDPSIDDNILVAPGGRDTVGSLKLPIASGNFWHQSIYRQLGGFDERFEYSPDAEYWYRAAGSFPVIKVKEPFAVYVAHKENYMWATWRRPDFLQQTGLLARTVADYTLELSPDRSALLEDREAAAIWGALKTILSCSFLTLGRSDIFGRYLSEAWQRARSWSLKWQLAAVLLRTLLARCRRQIGSLYCRLRDRLRNH